MNPFSRLMCIGTSVYRKVYDEQVVSLVVKMSFVMPTTCVSGLGFTSLPSGGLTHWWVPVS